MNELVTRLPDGGPKYFETNLDHVIAEPWNAASAFLFLIIVAWWYMKLKGRFRRYKLLSIAVPILAIGGIGGTLYHAFRVSQVFLLMDWLPILILTLMGSYHFVYLVSRRWWVGLVFLSGGLALQFSLYALIPPSLSTNIGYTIMALLILLPVMLVIFKSDGKYSIWVVMALVSFCLALFFRIYDAEGWLPMGTHFLWHTFGAIACHAIFMYIFLLGDRPLGQRKHRSH